MANFKYSYKVKIGNWNDELYLEEEKLKIFMLKRERGELLIQNIRQLTNNLYREVVLDIVRENQIRFGNVVQLISPDNCKTGKVIDVALSGNISEKEIDKVQHLSEGSELTGSIETKPCIRNCFRICSENYDRCGETLKYGQAFSLSAVESQNGPLYIEAEVPTFYSTFGISRHPMLQFTRCKNFYSLWRILPLDHGKRKELEGKPVPDKVYQIKSANGLEYVAGGYVIREHLPYTEPVLHWPLSLWPSVIPRERLVAGNTRFVVSHVASNQNLAAETHFWRATFFGEECEITTHTYLNIYRQETKQNVWMFVTRKLESLINEAT